MDPRLDAAKVLLSTDLVDSTQLNDRLGDAAMADWWERHDRAARDLIRQHGGIEIGRSDGFLVLFEQVDAALHCALDYHDALARLTPPIESRAGIHLGPMRLRLNSEADVALGAIRYEVDGLALPMAVRTMAAALGRQTLLTAPAFGAATCNGLRTCSHGHWRLKGVAEPVELVEVGRDLAPLRPPDDSAKAYRVVRDNGAWLPVRQLPNSLPAERDHFVGRDPSLTALASLFDGGARLVTVLGPGGIGKTRLALRYARSWLGDHPGGAWFCDLSSAVTHDGVLHAVAQGLRLPLAPHDPAGQLAEAIAGRGAALLVLDNLEQVVPVALPVIDAWLKRAPDLRCLVTSRVLTGLAGEQLLELPPLEPGEAADLFLRRAAGAGPTTHAAGAHDAVTAELVELLDRLPLAIELAAARTRLMSPRTLLDRMGERFRLLVRLGGPRDRQSTLRATLDWSWDLLKPADRTALAQLSVFEGGFTLGGAEAVIQVEGGDGPWAGDLVQSLIEQSLLQRHGEDRFVMLRSVQDYAADRLQALGGRAEAWRRHGGYFASLDEQALTNRPPADMDNLVAACRRAAAAGDGSLAASLLERAGALLQIVGPVPVLHELARAVIAIDGLEPAKQAAAERMLGNACRALGHREEGIAAFRRGLAVAHAAGDARQFVRLQCALSDPLMWSGERDEARALLESAHELAQRSADPLLAYFACNGLGGLALAMGDAAAARPHFESALAAARSAGHVRFEGGAQGNLGVVHHLEGRPDEAAACYRASFEVATRLGDRHWAANARCNLGLLLSESGQHEPAEPELAAVATEAREMGQSLLEATALCNLGFLLLATARPTEAGERLERAAGIAERLGDHRLGAQCRRGRGQGLAELGREAEAQAELDRALQYAERAGDAHEQAHVLHQRARLARRLGDGVAADKASACLATLLPRLSAAQRAALEHPDPRR